jgi:hypothetical protein
LGGQDRGIRASESPRLAPGGQLAANGSRLGVMDLEEKSLDQIGDRCEECGAKLTPQEIQAAMESGGPALCSIHAAEDEPGLAADEAGFTGGD